MKANNKKRLALLEAQNKIIIEKFLLMELQAICAKCFCPSMITCELYTLMRQKAAIYHFESEYSVDVHFKLMQKVNEIEFYGLAKDSARTKCKLKN